MHQSLFPYLLAAVAYLCLQLSFAEAGIIKGFKKEVPSPKDLSPAFDHATRKLKEESIAPEGTGSSAHRAVEDVGTTAVSAPRGNDADSAPGIGATEVSFMIVSFWRAVSDS
jgi:hypothetical protein